MKLILFITLIIVIALVASRRFLFQKPLFFQNFLMTGSEFILLGLVLGSPWLEILDRPSLVSLNAIIGLGLGWVGLLYGLQFNFRQISRFGYQFFFSAVFQGLLTILLLSLSFFFLFVHFADISVRLALIGSLVLGAASAFTAPAILSLVYKELPKSQWEVANFLRYISGVGGFSGIILLGVIFCLPGLHTAGEGTQLAFWQWLLVSVALGVLIGFIFNGLSMTRLMADEILTLVAGMLIFSSGVSFYLGLSSLFINFVAGIVLANMSLKKERILNLLGSQERSIYIFLLIVAGATWKIGTPWALLFALVYIGVRFVGKVGGLYLGVKIAPPRFSTPPFLGLGLISHGGMAIAIILNFQQALEHPVTDMVVSTLLIAVIINELISPYLTRRALRPEER